MATIKDVAKHANVSMSTVSAVINNKSYVSDEMRSRVEQSIEALGYIKNPFASNLKSRNTNTIAVLIPNITSIFFPEILKGIERAARDNGISIFFCDTNKSIEEEKEYMQIMKNYWVNGIILDTLADLKADREYYDFIVKDLIDKNNISVVVLESGLNDKRISSVSVDNFKSAYLCTEHLIELGHTKIAHITGNTNLQFAQQRTDGYRRALEDHGLAYESSLVVNGDFSPFSGFSAMKQLLMEGHDFTGVFSSNDQMLVGAIKAMKQSGLRVPEDVAAVGFDNTFVASLVEPSLTTINVPRYKMGYTAVELILQKEQAKARNIVLEGNIIVRRSSNIQSADTLDLYGW